MGVGENFDRKGKLTGELKPESARNAVGKYLKRAERRRERTTSEPADLASSSKSVSL